MRKGLLISFLNDIFNGIHEKIEDVEFLKLDQNPEIAMLRHSIVDVLCRDKKGYNWIIEMQCTRDSSFIKRAAAYASREQRTTEKEKGYKDLRPVILPDNCTSDKYYDTSFALNNFLNKKKEQNIQLYKLQNLLLSRMATNKEV
ncbi:MAG: Rpn family recombination-promoting nuclease/putative transposase [Bacteroidales bacterium]|nr:Rpn family recombination-promoting nuclease/putative transposase [Bacteroidales bacterium]